MHSVVIRCGSIDVRRACLRVQLRPAYATKTSAEICMPIFSFLNVYISRLRRIPQILLHKLVHVPVYNTHEDLCCSYCRQSPNERCCLCCLAAVHDDSLISPSELAILDSLMNGGVALSLKVSARQPQGH